MENISEIVKEKLPIISSKTGVYLMKNRAGKVIYVGKAKILKNRIKSYFHSSHPDEKTQKLVKLIADFEYIITSNEQEALLLENNLIKKYRPKFNVMLKDDKEYPFIKITMNEPFPKIIITRKLEKDGAKYFGPYVNIKSIRRTVRLLEWIFPYRTCNRNIPRDKIIWDRECINYQLGKCPAPCTGKIDYENYRQVISKIIYFLKGKNEAIISDLKSEMEIAVKNLAFEKAAKYRDMILNLQKLNRKQNMYFTDQKDRDVIGFYKEDKKAAVAVLKLLSGKLLSKEIYEMDNISSEQDAHILAVFLTQYYTDKLDKLPYRIIIQEKPEDYETLNSILHNKLKIPHRGELKTLQAISRENAFNYIEEQKLKYLRKSSRTIYPIKELKDKLKLNKLPRKMICLDISTIQGTDTVSSLVFFENGKPLKKNYRHYIIKTVTGQDDFASMAETMSRYFAKIDENTKPDLIVIDGGKGQLNRANKILQSFQQSDIEIISLAKRMEEIFFPDKPESVILPKNSSALRLLINIRDEAHRFAITFHRKRRNIRFLKSELDDISGVGKESKFALLKKFSSVKAISQASVEELCEVRGIGIKTAEKIKRILQG